MILILLEAEELSVENLVSCGLDLTKYLTQIANSQIIGYFVNNLFVYLLNIIEIVYINTSWFRYLKNIIVKKILMEIVSKMYNILFVVEAR